jgi:hypothetical protein
MKKHHLILSFLGLFSLFTVYGLEACTLYKMTQNGKTLVGNNEDWTSPNGQFWFEPGENGTYGAMYMGFLNDFIQGGINEKGLVFDGFYQSFKSVDTEGKEDIPIGDALRKVMQTMETAEEVKEYLSSVNLSILENGQLVFVDASGTYLIVEGDVMILGDEAQKSFSNFYYSDIETLDDVELPYFKKGQQFIKSGPKTHSMDYCSEAMGAYSQNGIAPTQYTTIYDLSELTIRVHLKGEYDEFIELDLMEELKKGTHKTMIAELFPKDSEGYQYYLMYNDPDHPTQWLENLVGDQTLTEQEYMSNGFDYLVNELGYEWLDGKGDPEGAIKVFSYGTNIMPNHSGLYDSLGEAYFKNDDLENAKASYTKSLSLNPENENATEMLSRIENFEMGN